MEVSIIIINYKTPELVIDCIKSIKEKTSGLKYEIIVVDNASNDASIEILQNQCDDDIVLMQSNVNLGFGKANNLGAKKASGKYLFLLNSDTVLVNNAIYILYRFLIEHSNVGIVGGNLYTLDMQPSPSFSMNFDTIHDEKKKSSWLSIMNEIALRKFSQYFIKNSKLNSFNYSEKEKKVGYIFGTDILISKQLFDELDGFDRDFFMYAEEEELSLRVTHKGYEIWNVPQAKIIHYDGASTKKSDEFSERSYKMRLTSLLLFYDKTYGDNGAHLCYKYKMIYFDRLIYLSRVLKRKMLFELTLSKKKCLEEVYQEYLKKEGVINGRN